MTTRSRSRLRRARQPATRRSTRRSRLTQRAARLDPRPPVRFPLPMTTAVREERKVLTAVFADVVGSTALAERLDPEDVKLVVGEAGGGNGGGGGGGGGPRQGPPGGGGPPLLRAPPPPRGR